MRYKIILLMMLSALFISCSNNSEKNKEYQTITIINNTPVYISISVIIGDTTITNAEEFYLQSHDYLIKRKILNPKGSKRQSDQIKTDRYTYYADKNKYDVTLIVYYYENNRGYETYINKHSFTFTEDKTITIGLNGQIY